MAKTKYRHEIKHFINMSDVYILRSRLAPVLERDPFANQDNKYKIRSLYYDSIDDKALKEKVNGYNKREKFRIRFYDDDTSIIKLEKKSKTNGLCSKESTIITKEQCESLINGNIDWMKNSDSALLVELYSKIKHQLLRPKTVVDYYREAYIYKPGNVRVTIDTDIRSGIFSKDIFDPKLPTVSVLPYGEAVLEVKYDGFLPDIVRDLIQTNNRRSSSISKYVACRMYG